MRRTFDCLIVILLPLGAGAACSRSDAPATAQSATQSAARAASAPSTGASADVPLNLCSVMPVDVVSGVLQSQIGRGVAIATPHTGGMCDYKDVDKGVPRVEVLVDFTALKSATDAAQAYHNVHTQAAGMGLPLVDVPGVGAEAYGSSDAPESYGVKTHAARYMGQVNVRAQGVSTDAIRPAATQLAKLTLARLP